MMGDRRMHIFVALAFIIFFGIGRTLSAEELREGSTAPPVKDFSVLIERSGNRSHLLRADVAFCSEITNKECVENTTRFSIDDAKIYCHTTVYGSSSYMEIKHLWYHDGKIDQIVRLPVNSSRWRTWSLKTLDSGTNGDWRVEIYAGDIKIGQGEFIVAEKESSGTVRD